MAIKKYNIATFYQGLTIGAINTFILFELNEKSIVIASLWTVAFIAGTILSGFYSIINLKLLNTIAFITRISTLPLLLIKDETLQISLLFIAGSIHAFASRKQYILLKDLVSSIKIESLTLHGSLNALGFGVGAVFSGFMHSNIKIFIISTIILSITTFFLFPKKEGVKINKKKGLTKRDLYIASIFTIAIVPLNNSLGMLIYVNIFNEKLAAIGAFLYNLGSVTSPLIKKNIIKLKKPIGISVLISSVIFITTLIFYNVFYYLISRVIIGGLLFAGQGLLEERAKNKEGKLNKGLEQLWQLFSLFSLISMLILPSIGERFGYISLGILSLFSSIVIMSLKLIIK